MSDINDFWDNIESSYPTYPTVRHRKRFVSWAAEKFIKPGPETFIFDYGCGNADILKNIKDKLGLNAEQVGGSDLSIKSIEMSKNKINSPYFYNDLFPTLPRACDAIVCSEVIEHVADYEKILNWTYTNLKAGGIFILSTQAGKMHKIDKHVGHIQTFDINDLVKKVERLGFTVIYKKLWGWPFNTMQKYLTDYNFNKIKNTYLEGVPSMFRKIFLNIVYIGYFIHDLINKGPQIYIIAKK